MTEVCCSDKLPEEVINEDEYLDFGDTGEVPLDEDLDLTAGEFLDDEWNSFSSKLSDDQISALSQYTGMGAEDLNLAMRADPSMYSLTDRQAELVANMDSAFWESSLSEDVVAYRAGLVPDGPVGTVFTEEAFTSTSLLNNQARNFLDEPGEKLIKIYVKGGSRAIPISGLSNFPEEMELLLNGGSRFRILSRSDKEVVLEML